MPLCSAFYYAFDAVCFVLVLSFSCVGRFLGELLLGWVERNHRRAVYNSGIFARHNSFDICRDTESDPSLFHQTSCGGVYVLTNFYFVYYHRQIVGKANSSLAGL